jgi:hypothetical protein
MSTPLAQFRHRTLILVDVTVWVILFLLGGPLPTQLAFKQTASAQQSPSGATLKICLRLPDDSPFDGSANIRVIPTEGYEVTGFPTESGGEMLFRDVDSGTYSIEASAPGFLTVRRTTQIRPGRGIQTVFIIMKVKPLPPVLWTQLPVCLPEQTGKRARNIRLGFRLTSTILCRKWIVASSVLCPQFCTA